MSVSGMFSFLLPPYSMGALSSPILTARELVQCQKPVDGGRLFDSVGNVCAVAQGQ